MSSTGRGHRAVHCEQIVIVLFISDLSLYDVHGNYNELVTLYQFYGASIISLRICGTITRAGKDAWTI